MRCEDVRALLPKLVDDDTIELSAERHIESCLGCQAEVARYQKMVRSLAELRDARFAAPEGLLDDILTAVGGPSVVRVMTARRKAAIAGAVGAVAAGATATAVVLARRRGLKLATVFSR